MYPEKLRLLLLLFVAGCLLLVAATSSRPWMGQSPPSTQLALFYGEPQDGSSPALVARSVNALILTAGDEPFRDSVRAAGFTGPALQYLVAAGASGPPGLRSAADPCSPGLPFPGDAAGLTGDFCTTLHPNESNFLHNGRGERLVSIAGWQRYDPAPSLAFYVMNPASPDWRAYLARHAATEVANRAYSGLFLDNLDVTLYRHLQQEDNSDGTVQEFSSPDADARYQNAMTGELALLRATLDPRLSLWANLTGSSDEPDAWNSYLPFLDGTMDEFFIDRWDNSYADPTTWNKQLTRADTVLAQGKSFLGVAQGPRSDTNRMRFALASYLLLNNLPTGRAYFRYSNYADSNSNADPYAQLWLYADFATRLGTPRNSRYHPAANSNTWRRDFTCGHVDITFPHSASITLNPGCS